MQTASLFEFGSGGGIYGDDRDVEFKNCRIAEHSFVKHAEDGKTVIKTYPPGCMFGVDFYLEDRESEEKEFADQWYPVNDLPAKRMIELGHQPRPPFPGQRPNTGGIQPSVDGENPAVEGPFMVLEPPVREVWNKSAYAQFFEEIRNLANAAGVWDTLKERLLRQGVAAFNGLRAHMGQKAMPVSKKKEQEAKLTGQAIEARTILVPVRINQWPWEAADQGKPQQTAAAAAAPTVASASKAAPAPASAAAPQQQQASSGNGKDKEQKIASYVKDAIKQKGGQLQKKDLSVVLMQLMVKEGADRIPMIQTAHTDDFLGKFNGSEWIFDPATGTLAALQ